MSSEGLLETLLSVRGAMYGLCGLFAYSLIGAYLTPNALVMKLQFYQGVTLPDLWKMLVRVHFRIHPFYWPRFFVLFLSSLWQTKRAKWDARRYGKDLEKIELPKDPVFVIGHYRSGTTYLHEMLYLDRDQFVTPTVFQCWFPHTFLHSERSALKMMKDQTIKRPMDNIILKLDSPQEDEFALCTLTSFSTYTYTIFPSLYDEYKKFTTFKRATAEQVRKYKEAFLGYLRKVYFRHQGKTLLLKSPIHTGRVKMMLELFPNARFIHIYRNPYVVFTSNQNLHDKLLSCFNLQALPSDNERDRHIFEHYSDMYDAYLEDRKLIPKGNLIEFSYEDFEKDPTSHLEKIYAQFNIPNFDKARPTIEAEAEKRKKYIKNSYSPIEPSLRQKIIQNWGRFFDAFGYAK
eukprot:TRINITY_DN3512_c0_g1_i1.p1 TRINITY_DN3512_c0_g1~~TRINITY_DN3512_c0_g1_i1.p1  ORF type:complete len:403 (+),score=84.68 TRINITY_DN3512_c0_g1_i1:47-1255(+)